MIYRMNRRESVVGVSRGGVSYSEFEKEYLGE